MAGWAAAAREGGWVPQWSSPGYRGAMTGTMSDVSLSEAIVKLPHCGSTAAAAAGYCVNASELYAASRRNAFEAPSGGTNEGRVCLAEYITLGYVPLDAGCDAVVTRSLNYAHGDWALAQAAALLGRTDDAAVLLARSRGWARLLEPSSGGFLRPRATNGSWQEPFDEFDWGPKPGASLGVKRGGGNEARGVSGGGVITKCAHPSLLLAQ